MKVPAQFYRPMSAEQKSRRQRFEDLNAFVTARHGFIVSPPGDATVRLETLADSSLPDELRKIGYDVIEVGTGERILPCGMTAGWTGPVQTISHAGIVAVKRYTFALEVRDGFERTIR